jgi:hypothetical protein
VDCGVLAGRAHVEEQGGLAGGEAALQFAHPDGSSGWCFRVNHVMNI